MRYSIHLFILFIFIFINFYLFLRYKENEFFTQKVVPDVPFPFKNIYDDKGKKMNIIAISAPFRSKEHEDLYQTYKNDGFSFIGISSYLDFPNYIENPHEDRYHEKQNHNYPNMVDAWLNCFRKKGYTHSFKHLPSILMTEADLKDVSDCKPSSLSEKEYDFIYCCLKDSDTCQDGWQSYNRNWELAKKCLEVFCERGLKGVLVGREECEFTKKCDGLVKIVPFLPYHEFQDLIKKSRFLFVPNISDASPRVITESMCHNLPVLVNENILGGWHNVIPGVTGEFFNDETDVGQAVDKIMKGIERYQPLEWYKTNRGRDHSGVELIEFLKKVYPDKKELKKVKHAYI